MKNPKTNLLIGFNKYDLAFMANNQIEGKFLLYILYIFLERVEVLKMIKAGDPEAKLYLRIKLEQ